MGLEDTIDLAFGQGNVFFHSQPDFFYINTKVIMDEFITHPGNILPWDLDIFRSCFFRDTPCRLSDDFNLPDDSVLNQSVAQKCGLAHALNVGLGFRNGVANMFEINRVVTLRRQADVPSGCGREGRDSETLL